MMKKRHLFAGLLSLAFSHVAVAQTFTVNTNADFGAGSLRDAIAQANTFNGAATINFSITNSTINLGSMLPILTNPSGITINGNNNIIDGGSSSNTTGDRVFFVGVSNGESAATTGFGSLLATTSTTWNINNLTIQNGNARGGTGSGGGAGLGGGLFLNAGNLTLSSVNFTSNKAIGGNGGSGGGGGMGGNGGNASGGGGGGFGIGANGGSASNGSAGVFTGGKAGADGVGNLNYPGGANGGGGGAGSNIVIGVSAGHGGGGGVGGAGVNGGFGGGGGSGGTSSATTGGTGGFGGGGGIGYGFGGGGNGGFGGGGGTGLISGVGGFGAGSASGSTGGGGLGAGGAVFVRQGTTLTIQDGGISGGTVAGGNGGNSGQSLGSGIFLAGSVNYSVTSGTVTINDTLGGGSDAQITGGFTKSGPGTLVLGGNNSYTGGTNITGGVLSVSSNSNLGATSNNLTFNNATLQVTGMTFNSMSRNMSVTNGTIDIADAGNTLTASGTVSGLGLFKSGPGTLVLTGTNTYSNGTFLNAGTLSVSSNANLGNASSPLFFNGGTLQVSGTAYTSTTRQMLLSGPGTLDLPSNSLTFNADGVISGSGGLTTTGSGVLRLTANNTYTGGTKVTNGFIQVSSDANLGNASSPLVFEGGGFVILGDTFTTTARPITGSAGVDLIINSATNTFTLNQNLSGVQLVKRGPGTLVVTGNNTHTSITDVEGGTLSVSSNANLGAASATIALNTGTLQVTGNSFTSTPRNISLFGTATIDVASSSNTLTASGVISSSGGLTKAGAGTLVLSGANTYTGGTNVNGPAGSTLKAGNNAALGASTNNLSIAAGNTFDINNFTVNVGGLGGTGNVTNTGGGGSITAGNGNASSTFDGLITQASSANPLTVGKVGTGTLTLTGNNNYTGATVVFGGTLLVNGNQSAATGLVLVSSGTKLGGSGTVGGDVTVDGGQLSPGNSPGILTLTKDVKFQNGASFQVEIQGTVAGTGYDQLLLSSATSNYVITGNSTLVGTRLGGFNIPNFTAFEIVKNPTGNLGTGTFAGLPDGSFFDFDGQQLQIRYNVPNNYFLSPTGGGITWAGDDGFGNYGADNGGSIVIAAVPEPSTFALIGATLVAAGYFAYLRFPRAQEWCRTWWPSRSSTWFEC